MSYVLSTQSLQDQITREYYQQNPAEWVKVKFDEHLWSKQRQIIESVRDNRRTAVHSCHASGKSYLTARIALWWLFTHAPGEAFVVTSASSFKQVRAILWRELGRAHAKGKLPGRTNQTELWIPTAHGKDELVAAGWKPDDDDPTAFQGIHCMDEEHEILTNRGWLGIDQIQETDKVLSVPVNGSHAEWMPITKIHRYPYKGYLKTYEGRTTNFSVTPEHRFPCKNQWKYEDYSLEPISKWQERLIRKSSKWQGVEIQVPEPFRKYDWSSVDFAKFIGFWCGDGGLRFHTQAQRFYEVLLYQTKSDKLEEVRSLLKNVPYRPNKDGFVFSDRHCAQWLHDNIGRYQANRTVPSIIMESTEQEITSFLDGFWLAEGTKRKNGDRAGAYTTSRSLADKIQELLIKIGKPASVGINRKKDDVIRGCAVSSANHDCLIIGWNNTCAEAQLIKNSDLKDTYYEGRVWCVSTPYETFYTRRKGKVCLSGNSRHVLVLFDESCGIGKLLWDAADTLISNEGSRIVVVGNPDDPVTEFYEVCKPGSGWNVIGISAFDTPNFTGEPVSDLVKASLVSETWVREKKRKWGESNPLYISKVLGEFPEIGEDGLIPLKWIRQAQDRDLPMDLPIELGVDVGGGGDKNIFCLRRGGHARIVRRDTQPDTMVTTGNVVRAIREHRPSRVKVDYIGIGRGAVDRLNEMGHNVEGVNVGEQAIDKDSYINLRAEGYWHLREIFQSGEIDIDSEDEDLAAQLAELQYKPTSGGKIQIESKLEMKRRLGHSPDDADALMLAFFEKKYKYTEATW